MHIIFEQDAEHFARGIHQPEKANSTDSGIDLYLPIDVEVNDGNRMTVNLGIKFDIKLPIALRFLKLFGLGIEAQIRPKSGRSKAGIDVQLGTVDEAYRNFVGVTIFNNTGKTLKLSANEKICQVVFVPVFNRVTIKEGKVNINTERGLNGFGSSGLTKKVQPQVDVKNTHKGEAKMSKKVASDTSKKMDKSAPEKPTFGKGPKTEPKPTKKEKSK